MGVKGLYSLLANEPSRFGHQWSTNPDTDVDIYIDAPALHHHLIHSYQKKINLPPAISLKDLDYNSVIVSPCTIYKLTTAFFEQLVEATSAKSRIHLVCDGVASPYKEKQQVLRIEENCELFDKAARSFINETNRAYHVPHLWGEDAMVEAFEDGDCEKFYLHYAPFEAETFIADMLAREDEDDDREYIVLSNDSDFLVFGVSFVPLHSLEYRNSVETSHTSLIGWEYTQSQFMAAFPEMDENDKEERFIVASTLAALTGCDYHPPSHLQRRISSARNTIINSNIGGLRQKHRNDPTAKFTLLAVLRYIIHFRTHSKHLWMNEMIKSIVTAEGDKDKFVREQDLKEALGCVRSAYRGLDVVRLEDGICTNRLVEMKRLLMQNKIYCKPVIELCEGSGNEQTQKRKSKSKGKKKKRTTKGEHHDSSCEISRIGEGGSISMSEKFVLCRNQLYLYLAKKYPPFAPRVDGERSPTVTEFARAGGSKNVTFRNFRTIITDKSTNEETISFAGPSFISEAMQIFAPGIDRKKQTILEECIGRLPTSFLSLLCVSLLLDSKIDVIFFLAMKLIPGRTTHKHKKHEILPERKEYSRSLGRLQIASHHTKLVFDALVCFSEYPASDFERSFSPRKMFCDEHLLASWNHVVELDKIETLNEHSIGQIKDSVKQTFKTRSYAFDEVVDLIWITWLKLNDF